MKELGTFGAIISFALELENQAIGFYDSLCETTPSLLFSQLLKGAQKRLGRLKRIRQELVIEMILEPITGVEKIDYVLELSETSNGSQLLEQAKILEENMGNFYTNTASLIPMKEVERAFLRLAKENTSRKAKLEE